MLLMTLMLSCKKSYGQTFPWQPSARKKSTHVTTFTASLSLGSVTGFQTAVTLQMSGTAPVGVRCFSV